MSAKSFVNSKGFSVITNWGCNHGCFFCLCKDIKTEPDIDYTALGAIELKTYPRVSISGGGEPLHDVVRLNTLVEFLQEHFGGEVSIHTRHEDLSLIPAGITKLTYSLWDIDQKRMDGFLACSICKKRLVFVDTGDVNFFKWYEWVCKTNNWSGQITFKPLQGKESSVPERKLPSNVKFLPTGDYNYYFYKNAVYVRWKDIPFVQAEVGEQLCKSFQSG